MMNKIISKGILFLLTTIVLLLIAYILSPDFRWMLSHFGIDPNYLIVFLTSIAILLGILQASRERRLAYNANLIESLEDKGLRIVGKLMTISTKAGIFNASLVHLNQAIKANSGYKDLNNLLDKSDIEKDLELIGAYIDIYYPELAEGFKELWRDLNVVANNFTTTFINYEANAEALIRGEHLQVVELSNIDQKLEESAAMAIKIDADTRRLRDMVIDKMNSNTLSLKKML